MHALRTKQDERKKNFKKGLDGADSRRKREEETALIRKNKREEMAMKRRTIAAFAAASVTSTPEDTTTTTIPTIDQLPLYVDQINSTDPVAILNGVRAVRKMLSRESHPPIDEVIR